MKAQSREPHNAKRVMPRGCRKTHEVEDQYGAGFSGGHRDDFAGHSSGGGGGTGGGDAGKRTGAKGNVTYKRQLPKFLQAYGHLVGEKTSAFSRDAADGETVADYAFDGDIAAFGDAEDAEARARAGLGGARGNAKANAMRDAFADDSDAKAELAAKHKGLGNRAFQEKRYTDAVDEFSRAVVLEPMNHVHVSNRSAAYAALGRWDAALVDANTTVRLNSGWAKGYARLANAYAGLERLSDAVEAWRSCVKYDDENEHFQASLRKAEDAEAQSLKEGKFKFQAKRKVDAGIGANPSRADDGPGDADNNAKAKKKKKTISTLSFDDEE